MDEGSNYCGDCFLISYWYSKSILCSKVKSKPRCNSSVTCNSWVCKNRLSHPHRRFSNGKDLQGSCLEANPKIVLLAWIWKQTKFWTSFKLLLATPRRKLRTQKNCSYDFINLKRLLKVKNDRTRLSGCCTKTDFKILYLDSKWCRSSVWKMERS